MDTRPGRVGVPSFVAVASGYLWVGLALSLYLGLDWLGVAPRVGWMRWSHVHVVTIGAFTHLAFAALAARNARYFGVPSPGSRAKMAALVGLNGSVALAWLGRALGVQAAFDAGLGLLVVVAAGLLILLLRWGHASERGWDVPAVLSAVSVFTFLGGLTYAFGLFGRRWAVPGGWVGLREAHIHANGWGFFGLAVIATMLAVWPRLVAARRADPRLARGAAVLLVIGVVPLMTGPWLGLRLAVTAPGLLLYAAGVVLYVAWLVRVARRGRSSGIARWLLVAQGWLLGPIAGAPVVFLGVGGLSPAAVERAVLHLFFLGWAVPVALGAIRLAAATTDPWSGEESIPTPSFSRARVWIWQAGVVLMGVGFLSNGALGAPAVAAGSITIAVVWATVLVDAARASVRE